MTDLDTALVNGWSESQFRAELRAAGWVSMGHGVYRHMRTEKQFQCFGFDAERGCENWRWYAGRQELPAAENDG